MNHHCFYPFDSIREGREGESASGETKVNKAAIARLQPRVVEALRECDKTGGKKLACPGAVVGVASVVIDKYSETLEFLNLATTNIEATP